MSNGIKPGSGGLRDDRLWLSVGVGGAAGAVIAFLGLPNYFSGGVGMVALGYGVFVLAGVLFGMLVGALLLRPDANNNR